MPDYTFSIEQNPPLEPLMDLWTTAFEEPRRNFEPVWRGFPGSMKWVATASLDGHYVASVVCFVFPVRGPNRPLIVGGIANVSTLKEHRGQGLSAKLLDMITEQFPAWDVDFGLLYTGYFSHYAKHGFLTFAGMRWTPDASPGQIIEPDSGPLPDVQPDGLLTLIRPENWREEVIARRTEHCSFWTTDSSYVIAHTGESSMDIVEAAGPDWAKLMDGATAWAIHKQGMTAVTSCIPPPHPCYTQPVLGGMYRPAKLNEMQCEELLFNPNNVFLPLDHF